MFVATELATASTWDAARHAFGRDPKQAELSSAEAAAIALPAYVFCAQKNIQLHGGIGFTWEHDAHLYLRRAQSLAAAYGTSADAEDAITSLLAAGAERGFGIELPPEAEPFRLAARAAVETYHALPEAQRRDHLVDSGYLVPHWPKPYGRAASAIEQLAIEEEFAEIELPNLGITGWNVLTILQHGTPDQIERWADDALRGKSVWCQLFSEPDAGSDAAAIKTRGVRVEGGWKVSGQKVWTSGAQNCQRGFATVRTDFDGPKHQGVTMMVIDLQAPGVEVRPLREITGESMFNEVFFDDVFVPDDDVVGPVGQGWTVARATLGNERVSIGAGSRNTLPASELSQLLDRYAPDAAALRHKVAGLVAEEHAMRLLNIRAAFRAVIGAGPGPEGNLTKLLSAEHAQSITEVGMQIAGLAAVTGATPTASTLAFEYLFARCLSIAGGTSEITRNVIAERLLDMPRDPLAK
jgi:alkylation response protein AidB-like acyl-CoA dehydrogenase